MSENEKDEKKPSPPTPDLLLVDRIINSIPSKNDKKDKDNGGD